MPRWGILGTGESPDERYSGADERYCVEALDAVYWKFGSGGMGRQSADRPRDRMESHMANSQQFDAVASMLASILPTKSGPKLRKMSDTLRAKRGGYVQTIASSGKASLDNGDAIAKALRGATPQQVLAVAQDLADIAGTSIDLAAKYALLNKGQVRMCAGNRIRGACKRGELSEIEAISRIAAKLA